MRNEEEKRNFGRVNAGYTSIVPEKKATNGSLYIDGYLFLFDLPFPLLQEKKKELIRKGYFAHRIKISYNRGSRL